MLAGRGDKASQRFNLKESEGAKTTKGDRVRRLRAAKGKKCPLPGGSLEVYQREGSTGQDAGSSRAGLCAPARSALTPSQSAGPTQASTQPAQPPRLPLHTHLQAPSRGSSPCPSQVPGPRQNQRGTGAATPRAERTDRGVAQERARAKEGPARAASARVFQGWENLVAAPPQPRLNKPD